MTSVKVQCRLDKKSYDLMMENLSEGENISDFIRKAVQLENSLRLLAKDD